MEFPACRNPGSAGPPTGLPKPELEAYLKLEASAVPTVWAERSIEISRDCMEAVVPEGFAAISWNGTRRRRLEMVSAWSNKLMVARLAEECGEQK